MVNVFIILIIIFCTIILLSILLDQNNKNKRTVLLIKSFNIQDKEKKETKYVLDNIQKYSLPSNINIESISRKIPFFYILLINSSIKEDKEQVKSMSTDSFYQLYLKKRDQYKEENINYFCFVKEVISITFVSFAKYEEYYEVIFLIQSSLIRYMEKDNKVIAGTKNTPINCQEEWIFHKSIHDKKSIWKIQAITTK